MLSIAEMKNSLILNTNESFHFARFTQFMIFFMFDSSMGIDVTHYVQIQNLTNFY